MTKITIDEQEFDTKDFTDVTTLRTGQNVLALLDHMSQCVQAIQTIKLDKLKESLKD